MDRNELNSAGLEEMAALYSKMNETERRIAAAYMQGMIAKGELMQQETRGSKVSIDLDGITAEVR